MDEIDELMSRVGALDDGIIEVTRIEDAAWRVSFEHIDVDVELTDNGRRLFFTTAIGAPAPADKLRIYEGFLIYNGLWRETGGVRLALEAADGAALQVADIARDGATAQDVVTVMVNLAERALVWQRLLAAVPEDETEAPAPADAYLTFQA